MKLNQIFKLCIRNIDYQDEPNIHVLELEYRSVMNAVSQILNPVNAN